MDNKTIEKFKKAFTESFGKVTPEEFITRMENLGYEFQEASLPLPANLPLANPSEEIKQKFFKQFGEASFRGYPLEQCHAIWDFFYPYPTNVLSKDAEVK